MTHPAVPNPQRRIILRYLAVMAVGNLLWEVGHVPLYTLWLTGTAADIAYAVLHCTLGDVLIAAITFGLAILLIGRGWPQRRFGAVAALSVLFALAYTVFSEWLNVFVRGSWAYRDIMPTLPPFGTGLTPLIQWVVLPVFSFWLCHRQRPQG